MSAVAVSSRVEQHSPEPERLTVTLSIPLSGEGLTPEASWLIEVVRELVQRGEGRVNLVGASTTAVAQPAGGLAGPSAGAGLGTASARVDGLGVASAGDGLGDASVCVDGLGGAAAGAGGFRDGRPRAGSGLRILAASRTVLLDGVSLQLTRLEFDVLMFLAENPRRVFSRLQLLTGVWGYDHACARTVDVLIGRLRSKIGVRVPIVTTVYGVGYRLADGAVITIDRDG
jgi:two-component system, OmpR family, response regulator